MPEISIQQIIDAYNREIASVIQRALIAEATVATLQEKLEELQGKGEPDPVIPGDES